MNKVFNWIFLFEMIYKLYALSIKGYFRDGFNIFEGFLVMTSLIDMILYDVMGTEGGTSILMIFRTLRLLKIFKLVTKTKALKILLRVIWCCFKDVSYYSIILFLYIFICALLGMELYAYNARVDNIEE